MPLEQEHRQSTHWSETTAEDRRSTGTILRSAIASLSVSLSMPSEWRHCDVGDASTVGTDTIARAEQTGECRKHETDPEETEPYHDEATTMTRSGTISWEIAVERFLTGGTTSRQRYDYSPRCGRVSDFPPSLSSSNTRSIAAAVATTASRVPPQPARQDPSHQEPSLGSPVPPFMSHVKQQETWDCGLACIQMITDWMGYPIRTRSPRRNTNGTVVQDILQSRVQVRNWMKERIQTRSIWTLDLVLLLEELLPSGGDRTVEEEEEAAGHYLFCTKSLSVNTAWNELEYYRDAFREDRIRLERGLTQIHIHTLPAVQMEHLPLREVARLVQREDCSAIVLVNNNAWLQIQQSATRNTITPTSAAAPAITKVPYTGHYVVLAGIIQDRTSSQTGCDQLCLDEKYYFVVYDPASDSTTQPKLLAAKHFEQIWRSEGTDEDIIFVVKRNHRV